MPLYGPAHPVEQKEEAPKSSPKRRPKQKDNDAQQQDGPAVDQER